MHSCDYGIYCRFNRGKWLCARAHANNHRDLPAMSPPRCRLMQDFIKSSRSLDCIFSRNNRECIRSLARSNLLKRMYLHFYDFTEERGQTVINMRNNLVFTWFENVILYILYINFSPSLIARCVPLMIMRYSSSRNFTRNFNCNFFHVYKSL